MGLRLSLNGSACDLEMGLLVFWLALLPQELQYLKQEPKPELEELLMQMERHGLPADPGPTAVDIPCGCAAVFGNVTERDFFLLSISLFLGFP